MRAGETSGDLAVVFGGLADFLEAQGANRAEIATALVYPAFVAAVSLLVCAILVTNVAPEIVAMFEVSGRPLPQLTQVVLGASRLDPGQLDRDPGRAGGGGLRRLAGAAACRASATAPTASCCGCRCSGG